VLAHLGHHLPLIGKTACLELRVEQFAIDSQLETAAAGGNQLQFLNLLFVGAEQLGRQTDGLGLVVSHRAVLQLHVHRLFSSIRRLDRCVIVILLSCQAAAISSNAV
jgi:hypothetical protein